MEDLLTRAVRVWTSPLVLGNLAVLVLALAVTGAWRQVGRRSVRTDVIYTLFYVGGLYAFLVARPLYGALGALVERGAPWLRLDLLAGLPAAVHFVLLYVVMDGLYYWAHRALHASPWLWRFHAVHHSQQALTPLTNFRFHAGDVVFRGLVQMVPGIVLGSPAAVWAPVVWLQTAQEALSHADVGWGYGPLGRIVVSPRFHRIHHSAEARHAGRNYAAGLGIWDRLFGTAADEAARPQAYGVAGVAVPESFLRQVAFPFLPRRGGEPK